MLNTNYAAAGCNYSAAQALNLSPANGNTNLRNIPYEYKQTNYTLAADYRITRNHSINAAFEREEFGPLLPRAQGHLGNKFKLSYVNRAMEGGTLRISGEYDSKRGSEYISDPYEEFYSGSLGPIPTTAGAVVNTWIHVLANLRKFDLARRTGGGIGR